MTFTQYLQTRQERIQTYLEHVLPSQDGVLLHEAMRYAVLNGGKRLRPIFVYTTGEALGGKPEILDIPAAAIECMHCFSLIHDDLPAMDNSDVRRGKPTCHKQYGEAMAILAGDALHAFSFELLTRENNKLSATQRANMAHTLAATAGAFGMCKGQATDILNLQHITADELLQLYAEKTAALLWASIKLGAIAVNHNDYEDLHHLHQYALNIGLAFQIYDDILDVQSTTSQLGKQAGIDQALGKITYPALVGMDAAKTKVKHLHEQSLELLQRLQLENSHLTALTQYCITHTQINT